MVKHITQSGINVLGIEGSFIGIGDNRTIEIIGRDDDMSLSTDIEYIEASFATG